jgi:hypothetical protein
MTLERVAVGNAKRRNTNRSSDVFLTSASAEWLLCQVHQRRIDDHSLSIRRLFS